MQPRAMNLRELESFVRVVELGTITAAAAEERVPKSTISRRIARLEDELGVALLHRSGRAVTVTDDGRLLHARVSGAMRELAEAGRALSEAGDAPSGRLVLTAPHDLARSPALVGLLAEYQSRYPNVAVDVRLDNRMVDLVQEGIDVAIRAHGGEIPAPAGVMVRSLGRGRAQFFASRAYLDRHGAPSTVEELRRHTVACHTSVAQRFAELDLNFVANDFGLIRSLAEAGAAVALLPVVVDGAREHPSVVRVLANWSTGGGRMSLVWPESRHLSPRVRAFIDLAVTWLGHGGVLLPVAH